MRIPKSAYGYLRDKASSARFYPYLSGSEYGKEKMKKEVVQLGIELSVSVVETMFLLSDDDIPSMLWFCTDAVDPKNPESPVVERLRRVINYIYSKDIKPKKRVYRNAGNLVHSELIRTIRIDFAHASMILHRLVNHLRRKYMYYDDRLLSSAIEKCKQQVMKKIEDKLRSTGRDRDGDVGFVRETVKSNISYFWMSLFDEKATPPQVTRSMILQELFQPVLDESTSDSEMNPFNLQIKCGLLCFCRKDFAKEELKEEVVKLGVEVSLYVARSMFLLSDDIRSMLRFCYRLWINAVRHDPNSLVGERLLRVMHFVYLKDIKPKNGVYHHHGYSIQWRRLEMTWENLDGGIRDMDILIRLLRKEGECYVGRVSLERIEEKMKKVEEKLMCAKGNGYVKESIESKILDLWKSIFDKEAKEATHTLKMIKNRILHDLFHPLPAFFQVDI